MEKIDVMHQLFGRQCDKECKDCNNFRKWKVGGKTVYKCRIYGASHSNATDWRKKYQACGKFNQQPEGIGNIYLTKERVVSPVGELPGQIGMDI